MIKVGRLRQAVMYEGISSLCFYYGRLRHKQDSCCYRIKMEEKSGDDKQQITPQKDSQENQSGPNYGPWMLVTRRGNLIRNGQAHILRKSDRVEEGQKSNYDQNIVENDVPNTPLYEEPAGPNFTPARENLTKQYLWGNEADVECEIELCQDLPRSDREDMNKTV